MAQYLLVHGAWHGAWCWQKVVPLLTEKGHTVLAPDLPGHGHDKTPLAKITFEIYLKFLTQFIETAPMPVILVGHSFAGMIISALAERYPDKIKCLVYVAGFLPQNGQSMFQIATQLPHTPFSKLMTADPKKNAFYFPLDKMHEFGFAQTALKDFEALLPLFCTEPLLPLNTPVALSAQNFGQVPKVYIECLHDNAIPIQAQRAMHSTTPCRVQSLPSDHSPFYAMPEQLATILHQIE
ncbi:MAG: alpha/beta fold hydrolase [Proteobacteria bacterium]|nr:alpha/beta fold hydrolase [Pseudomonadota bacterium]